MGAPYKFRGLSGILAGVKSASTKLFELARPTLAVACALALNQSAIGMGMRTQIV